MSTTNDARLQPEISMTTQNSDTQNTVNEAPVKGVGTGELVRPISREDMLIMKIGELMLHCGFVATALDRLIMGQREMGKSGLQVAVLKYDVEELCKRFEDMNNVSWPNIAVRHAEDGAKHAL